jgi:uncharacterized protein (DUF1330 family)
MGRSKWQAVVNMVMNIVVLANAGSFLTRGGSVTSQEGAWSNEIVNQAGSAWNYGTH